MEESETDRTCNLNRGKQKTLEKLSLKISRRREDNTDIDCILYNDQEMNNQLTHYHTPTCFDTIVTPSGSS